MTRVFYLSDFPSAKENTVYIKQFIGKSYDDAVAQAEVEGEFLYYFEQKQIGKSKSILVCWLGAKDVEEENDSDTG